MPIQKLRLYVALNTQEETKQLNNNLYHILFLCFYHILHYPIEERLMMTMTGHLHWHTGMSQQK